MLSRGTRLLGALGLVAILTACSTGPVKQTEPPPSQQPDPGPVVADGGWRPTKGDPGQPASVKGPGLFLVDAESGKTEFWPALPGSYVYVHLSPDSRFVWSATPEESVLADRESGKSYRWTKRERTLIGATGGALLWEEMESGKQTARFRLERLDGTEIKAFTLPLEYGSADWMIPRLARLTKDAFTIWGLERDWQVDGATGEVTEAPRGRNGRSIHYETGNRYAAQLYRNALPVVTIYGADNAPSYRILAAYPSCGWSGVTSPLWRADGTGLLLWSDDGPVVADLDAERIDSLAVKDGDYWQDPAPSPTRKDRWGALGHSNSPLTLSSFGPGTTPVATGSIDWDRTGLSMDTQTPLWSADGRFLQFQAFLGGGKDYGCLTDVTGQPFLPPRLEKLPFADEITIEVATPGDCLNLRAEPSKEARLVTCLPDGTHLFFVERPAGENRTPGWALVRTEGKALGWVNTEGDFLRWAE